MNDLTTFVHGSEGDKARCCACDPHGGCEDIQGERRREKQPQPEPSEKKCTHEREGEVTVSCGACGIQPERSEKVWNCHAGVSHEIGCPHEPERSDVKCPHGCPWTHQPEHWHYKKHEPREEDVRKTIRKTYHLIGKLFGENLWLETGNEAVGRVAEKFLVERLMREEKEIVEGGD